MRQVSQASATPQPRPPWRGKDPPCQGSGHRPNAYAWHAEGKVLSDTPYSGTAVTSITYDALGRVVEQDYNGTYTEFAYDPWVIN